ncbi:MAG: glycine betaine/L-proline ABC transporter ATP-binding protein [Spirochaetota bacterium]|nr:glycine betaine/L-proline ABC transporter ATP-binding protein [Spirochaetota bacterium]
MAEEHFVEVRSIWKAFGREPKRALQSKNRHLSKDDMQAKTGLILALRDISFNVKKGELFVLMGLSGSGKSTLIRTFLRLIEPTAGHIIVDGKDVTRMKKEELQDFRRHKVSMVFQHYGLFPHYTVLRNAAYGLKARGDKKEEREEMARKALETVGLVGWEDYYPHSLSGGMQQRVGLARALATEPDLLLMDEPFSGLDPLIRRQMQDELVELQDKLHKTIIFVTHDLHEALKLGDRIAIMRNGEIIQTGTPEEVVTSPADDYVREFVQDASPAKVLTAENIMEDPEVLLYAWQGPKTARKILKDHRREWAFMVNKFHTFLGVISIDDLDKNPKATMEEFRAYSDIHIPACSPEMSLEELFPMAAKSQYPIPVLDENGKLLGVVRYRSIFDSMTSNYSNGNGGGAEESGAGEGGLNSADESGAAEGGPNPAGDAGAADENKEAADV